MSKTPEMHTFWVTRSDVGIIVETTPGEAVAQIKRARAVLARLGGDRETPTDAQPNAKARSLSERILGLGSGFFGEPREASQVLRELARSGFHHTQARVRTQLLRMVKSGALRRIGEGTKSGPYKYVNP